jgi:hypothetical protein
MLPGRRVCIAGSRAEENVTAAARFASPHKQDHHQRRDHQNRHH